MVICSQPHISQHVAGMRRHGVRWKSRCLASLLEYYTVWEPKWTQRERGIMRRESDTQQIHLRAAKSVRMNTVWIWELTLYMEIRLRQSVIIICTSTGSFSAILHRPIRSQDWSCVAFRQSLRSSGWCYSTGYTYYYEFLFLKIDRVWGQYFFLKK